MGKVRLELGAELDVLDKHELGHSLQARQDEFFRRLARGIKRQVITGTGQVAGAALLLGDSTVPGARILGPQESWLWRVERVSVGGWLQSSTDALKIYKGDAGAGSPGADMRFVDTVTTARPAIYPGRGCILMPGDHIVVGGGVAYTGVALATANGTVITVTVEAIAAPAEEIWKVIR